MKEPHVREKKIYAKITAREKLHMVPAHGGQHTVDSIRAPPKTSFNISTYTHTHTHTHAHTVIS